MPDLCDGDLEQGWQRAVSFPAQGLFMFFTNHASLRIRHLLRVHIDGVFPHRRQCSSASRFSTSSARVEVDEVLGRVGSMALRFLATVRVSMVSSTWGVASLGGRSRGGEESEEEEASYARAEVDEVLGRWRCGSWREGAAEGKSPYGFPVHKAPRVRPPR